MGHRLGPERARVLGFTLIEIMIYIGITAVIGVPLLMVATSVSRASAEGDTLSKILERNRTALQRIAAEYQGSLSGTTAVSGGGKTLQFTSSGGFDGAGPVAGPVIRYEIRLAPGEASNGIDDNHNGLIDEGSLVRVNLSTNEETVITGILNTRSSTFVPDGGGVTATIATFGHARGVHAVSDAQCSVTLYPRN